MTHSKAYRLTRASFIVLWRRIPYMFLASACLYGTGYLMPKLYHLVMPGSWWISITQPVHVNNVSLGKSATVTFCRRTRYDNIKVHADRSFYQLVNNHEVPAGSYSFDPTIERNKNCQYPTILPSKLPRKAGTYKMHTDLTFYIDGNKKVIGYDIDQPFSISDTAKSLQEQIEELNRQIEDLKGKMGTSELQPATQVFASSAGITPSVLIARQTQSTRPSPTTSSPPNPPMTSTTTPVAIVPPEPDRPINPAPIQGTVTSVLQTAPNTLQGILSLGMVIN